MTTQDLLRTLSESMDLTERAHPNSRCSLEYDDLEPRHLLSAAPVLPPHASTGTLASNVPEAIGATAGAAGPSGFANAAALPSSVATGSAGINSLQTGLPVNDLLSNLSQVSTGVYAAASPLSAASGLTELPITALLPPTVTENETPLNNGTPITGTVWLTPAPEPSGIFHFGTTISPVFSHLYLQTVNPEGGPPSFTHFSENSESTLGGVAIEEPVAVGPVGPSITVAIQPVQPPPVEAHQMFGPPPQLQQGETTAQQDARTPPGGMQGHGQSGTPSQGVLVKPQITVPSRLRRRGAAIAPRPVTAPPTHHVPIAPPPLVPPPFPQPPAGREQGFPPPAVPPPAVNQPAAPAVPPNGKPPVVPGAQTPAGPGQAAPGAQAPTSPGQAAPGAQAPSDPKPDSPPPATESSKSEPPEASAFAPAARSNGTASVTDLVDAAIPSVVSDRDRDRDAPDDIHNNGHLSTLFGAAALATGGLPMVLRDPSRLDRARSAGPPDGAPSSSRRNA